jgi:hypothetical protein
MASSLTIGAILACVGAIGRLAGCPVGFSMDSCIFSVGILVGCLCKASDGLLVAWVGRGVWKTGGGVGVIGCCVTFTVVCFGNEVGTAVGFLLGSAVELTGIDVGITGFFVGTIGFLVGFAVGLTVGREVGFFVGVAVAIVGKGVGTTAVDFLVNCKVGLND